MGRPAPRFWMKVLAALLIVGVLPIGLVSAVSVTTTRGELTELGVTNIRQRALSTANAIDAYIASRLGDIVLVARIPDVVRHATYPLDADVKNAARDALKAAAARSPEYESVGFVDLTGKITTASIQTDEGTSVAFREYFLTAKAGKSYVSDPSYSVITNRPALFFSAPVQAPSGQVLGVVRTRVNLAAVWDLVEADADSVGRGSHGFLLDDQGIRLAVSETRGQRQIAESLIYQPIAPIDAETAKELAADRRFGQKTPEQLVLDPLPALKATLDDLKRTGALTGSFAYDAAGEQRGVAARLATKPWAYVLAVPLATYTKAADDATMNAALMLAVGVLLALVIGVMLTRSLVPRRSRRNTLDERLAAMLY